MAVSNSLFFSQPYIQGIKAVGGKIREVRKQKGFSQEELANLRDLSLSQVSRIETGAINTSISHIFLLAKYLGVQPKELFEFEIKFDIE